MRSVAAAIGTAPASLYRYVLTRDELVELMADSVYGEFSYDGPPQARRLRTCSASQGGSASDSPARPSVYRRHHWLLDVTGTEELPGPNAVTFIEHTLAALSRTNLGGAARLEFVGLFSGAVRLIAQTEIGQLRAGPGRRRVAGSVAAYLLTIAADGQHPNLAAALTGQIVRRT